MTTIDRTGPGRQQASAVDMLLSKDGHVLHQLGRNERGAKKHDEAKAAAPSGPVPKAAAWQDKHHNAVKPHHRRPAAARRRRRRPCHR